MLQNNFGLIGNVGFYLGLKIFFYLIDLTDCSKDLDIYDILTLLIVLNTWIFTIYLFQACKLIKHYMYISGC